MSDPDGPWSSRSHLTTLLCEHPGAVPTLLSLLATGGSAAFASLATDLPRASEAGALRWLTAENLVQRESPIGSLDVVAAETVFRLTTLGTALASSIAGIATLVDVPPAAPPSAVRRFFSFRNSR